MQLLVSINKSIDKTAVYTGTQGLYVGCNLHPDSKSLLHELCIGLPLNQADHCTVMYSKDSAPSIEDIKLAIPKSTITAMATRLTWWEGHDREGYIILRLQSQQLVDIHKALTECGAVHGYPNYEPHITMCKRVPEPPASDFTVRLVNQYLRKNSPELTLLPCIVQDLQP
jgi:hypothetical protein